MKKIRSIALSLALVLGILTSNSQSFKEVEISKEWILKIERLAPTALTVKNVSKKKILVFSKATGFDHWTIPHNAEMLKILGKKTGVFEVHVKYDIEQFEKKNLKKYDAVIFNNCNPSGPDRDLFADLLRQNSSLTALEIKNKAPEYEANMMNYVKKGGGLMILHGAITVQNNSSAFSGMTGGSFDYHPKQQQIHLKEVDGNHPLVQAFNGNGFTHFDEPYFFKNAYFDYNFRPLLYMEVDQLDGLKKEVSEKVVYVSWIKKYGKGRVFYSSPSHNAQSMDNPELLQFFLDGMQYVVGDLICDDSAMKK
ncbi:ThuA domain-containing protein [Maribacter sp. HTCC2170]|uniref:ThuA domain-containing protein n=1 Tax=Maribacter sp. (strain HTCC2170 / KCCM 42371) TaxID=313603 RepID=UPI00006B492E|nr:ThuA domain-containing protein [Maribacter sp. HTCC2170]EAR00902.1 putative glycosyl hydrolase (putative secreted protein) [Maribacter sp. HTCC2170]